MGFFSHGGNSDLSSASALLGDQPKRRRFNTAAVLINVVLSWALFCLSFAVSSFSLQYAHPTLCWFLMVLSYAPSILCVVLWKYTKTKQKSNGWYLFSAFSLALAVACGTFLGNHNYVRYTKKFMDIGSLARYQGVNPDNVDGATMIDAGIVSFARGAHVDVSKAIAFRNQDVYCVAPIVMLNAIDGEQYDMWAAGKNCCHYMSANDPVLHFQCGDVFSPSASGGLREVDDVDRSFYRLAVSQAESRFGLKTKSPLFFQYSLHPVRSHGELHDDAASNYLVGIWFYFGFSIVMTSFVAVGFLSRGWAF